MDNCCDANVKKVLEYLKRIKGDLASIAEIASFTGMNFNKTRDALDTLISYELVDYKFGRNAVLKSIDERLYFWIGDWEV